MKRFLFAFAGSLFLSGAVLAQQQFPTLERGLQPEKLYHFAGIDNVNMFNGNLTIQLPIGLSYAINGGLSYQLTLSYNSNVWDYYQYGSCSGSGQNTAAMPAARSNAGMGWILGFGDYISVGDVGSNGGYNVYAAPDGGDHRFEKWSEADPYTQYTADGSGLRLRAYPSNPPVAFIDFPDGSSKGYIRNGSGHWDPAAIYAPRGAATVSFHQLSSRPTQCTDSTESSWWSISDGLRTHYLCYKNYDMDGSSKPMINEVALDGPGGSYSYYRFSYSNFNVELPLGESNPIQTGCYSRMYHSVTVLTSMTLPDGSAYKFTHESDLGPPHSGYWGSYSAYVTPNLLGVTLPTGGRIEYTMDSTVYNIPPMSLCMFGYTQGPRPYNAHAPTVVTARTERSAVLSGGTPVVATWNYTYGTQGGQGPGGNARCNPYGQIPDPLPDELVTSVKAPNGSRVDAHYSVWPGDMIDDSPNGFKGLYYGFPYGRYDAAQNRYLSTEQYDCSVTPCQKVRSTYVRHDLEVRQRIDNMLPWVPEPFHRLASERVFYHDDPANCVATGSGTPCHSKTNESQDWDGFTHYRQVTRSYDFGTVGSRTEITDWNKPGGVQRVIAATDPWTLDEYENHSITEGGLTVADQACFAAVPGDATHRFLRGKRSLKGAAPGSTDVVGLFGLGSDANLNSERFFGGDNTPLLGSAASALNLCTALDSVGTPAYQITHTWQNGIMATSQYAGMSFLSGNVTVDQWGMITGSRDAAGVLTTYSYDTSGRITAITPTGSAPVSYTYSNAQIGSDGSLTTPARVVENLQSTVAPIQRNYIFDSFGRVWRETTQMPKNKVSLRETLYDASSRRKSVSEWTDLPSGSSDVTATASAVTSFDNYDIFGRVGRVTTPDGSAVTFGYTGDRVKTHTANIWMGGVQDTPVTSSEEYDGFGRLRSVTQKSGPTTATTTTGSDVLTSYEYDPENHLTSSIMGATSGPVQSRYFDYDGRGFLRWESLPESGVISYEYDSRGHMVSKIQSAADSPFDLKFFYDPAERMTLMQGRNPNYDPANPNDPAQPQFRPIKEFVYENAGNNGADLKLGKVIKATRHNYGLKNDYVNESEFEVADSFQYADAAGRKTQRTTSITEVFAGARWPVRDITMSVEYNDLDMPVKIHYPTCPDCGVPPTDPDRSLTTRTYDAGHLTALSGYVTDISFWANGMRNVLAHANGIADTQTVTNMARPSEIKFGTYDRCVKPTITTQPTGGQVASSGAPFTLSVSASGTGPLTYVWYGPSYTVVGTNATITVNPTGTSDYFVDVTGPCGHQVSEYARVTIGQCDTPSTGAIYAVRQPDGSYILTPNVRSRLSQRSFTWTRPPNPASIGSTETLAISAPSVTTTYRLTVRDECGSASGDVEIDVPLTVTPGLVATWNGSNGVSMMWSSITGATTYTIERRSGSTWEYVGQTGLTTYLDTSAAASTTYLYEVYADNGGFTNMDVATTLSFVQAVSNQPITPDAANAMLDAVNRVRGLTGWPALTWANILAETDPLPSPGAAVLARHIMSCRARMNEALQAAGVVVTPYSNPDLTGRLIYASDINEVQQRAQ